MLDDTPPGAYLLQLLTDVQQGVLDRQAARPLLEGLQNRIDDWRTQAGRLSASVRDFTFDALVLYEEALEAFTAWLEDSTDEHREAIRTLSQQADAHLATARTLLAGR